MKCLILAGGSGDRLWPLSRQNYPKQFMEIRKNRSLLQETVARNMPFCEEFLIVANSRHHFIVEGQMKSFQGLRYRIFYEEIPRKTAAAIAMACFACNPSDLVFVVAADHLIKGDGYREAVLRSKELAEEGYLVALGIDARTPNTEFGYIRYQGEDVLEFKEKPDGETAKRYVESGRYLWNSGMFLFSAGDFLDELRKNSPDIYKACALGGRRAQRRGSSVTFPREVLLSIPEVCVEQAVFEKSKKVKAVRRDFEWCDVGHLEDMSQFADEADLRNCILEDCTDTSVINRSERRLVVANGMEDTVIVNTEDAVYVGKKGSSPNLKGILRQNMEEYRHFFEDNRVSYRPWGTYEVLNAAESFRVKKITIFPGATIYAHRHAYRSEHWSIVQGRALITLEGEEKEYAANQSIDVAIGVTHQVSNIAGENLVIIEVAIGESVTEKDMISIKSRDLSERDLGFVFEDMVKLSPAYKDYIWGGEKLREIYGKECDYDIIAESWELSSHEAGQSVVASGRYRGIAFGAYLDKLGREALGWKCQDLPKFPLLIKFIDARGILSVQVHPGDEYAMREEGEYGKNEMWYVAQCQEGSYLYCGFSRAVTKDELLFHIENHTVTEILNRVPVKQGDVFFIEAGTVHAIGPGILIYEIQQNSNSTYRLYDFDRRDKFGNLRELHLEKALAVVRLEPYGGQGMSGEEAQGEKEYGRRILGQCKYFESVKYEIRPSAQIDMDETSFAAVTFLSGSGVMESGSLSLEYRPGETFFIPAGKKKISVKGCGEMILTHV